MSENVALECTCQIIAKDDKNKNIATSFLATYNDKPYLITNKHVIDGSRRLKLY